jgi:hypothetical protein
MALSPEDRAEIIDVIQHSQACSCGLSRESQMEVGHFFGRLKDLGRGNLNEGIEIFSKAIAMMSWIRRAGEKIGGAVAIAVSITIAGSVLTLLVWGAQVWIKLCLKGD